MSDSVKQIAAACARYRVIAADGMNAKMPDKRCNSHDYWLGQYVALSTLQTIIDSFAESRA